MFQQVLSMTGTQASDFPALALVNFTSEERKKFMVNVMNLTPKIREEAIFKAVALDKQISRIQLTRRITNRKFFTDEMGSSEPPDPKMADGGNSYEVEKNCCLAIRCNKVWRKSMEMKQKLISFPGQAVFCGECGCLIDRERVEEVPHTAHCVKCKNSHNGNGHNGS